MWKSNLKDARLANLPRPREFLASAENQAVAVRKVLASIRSSSKGLRRSEVMDDAGNLAEIIELISVHGQRQSAENAILSCELVEQLVDQLRETVDELLAS